MRHHCDSPIKVYNTGSSIISGWLAPQISLMIIYSQIKAADVQCGRPVCVYCVNLSRRCHYDTWLIFAPVSHKTLNIADLWHWILPTCDTAVSFHEAESQCSQTRRRPSRFAPDSHPIRTRFAKLPLIAGCPRHWSQVRPVSCARLRLAHATLALFARVYLTWLVCCLELQSPNQVIYLDSDLFQILSIKTKMAWLCKRISVLCVLRIRTPLSFFIKKRVFIIIIYTN